MSEIMVIVVVLLVMIVASIIIYGIGYMVGHDAGWDEAADTPPRQLELGKRLMAAMQKRARLWRLSC